MTFRGRLTLVSAVAVAVAIALASTVIYLVVRGELRGEVDEALRGRVNAVSYQVTPFGIQIRFPELPLGAASGYAQIVDSEGHVSLPGGETIALPISPQVQSVAAGRVGAFFEDAHVAGTHVRVLTAPLARELAVQVARPLAEVDHSLHRLTLILLLVTLGGVALAAAVGGVVAKATVAPVRRLTEATEHVTSTSDLSERIEAPSKDELGRLASSFNTMLEALEASIRSQRQLVADASHELRTPLTSLRTNVEVLAASGPSLPDEERRRIQHDIVAQVEELTTLINDLMELARGNEPPSVVEVVHLDELTERALERARIHSPHVRFEARLEPSLVEGVPSRLERAIGNLLDNAAKWSAPGASVEVKVREGEVAVRDHGPGISPEDLPHVFDRFYRAPSARGLPGSGLGLAIVRQVAESHGGKVSIEAAEGGGALFRIRLKPFPGGPHGEESEASDRRSCGSRS
jgi:two-component system sensor histidine kinase MprB